MSNNNGFFAVERARFYAACELGMKEAVSYLVLCSGTQKNNTTSSWSVNAIENYTGISRTRARKAVDKLIENEIISVMKTSSKPRAKPTYLVKGKHKTKKIESDSIVWLPNSLIVGVSDETPPVERVRQTQEIMVLRMLFDFYSVQDLVEEVGIPKDILRVEYSRELIHEYAEFKIYGFNHKNTRTFLSQPSNSPHVDHEPPEGENAAHLYFYRLGLLKDMGLIEAIPYIHDSSCEDGEPAYPITNEIGSVAYNCVHTALSAIDCGNPEKSPDIVDCYKFVVPILRDKPNAALFGIYQLRYKARTAYTGKWFAENQAREREAVAQLQNLYGRLTRNTEKLSSVVGF